VIFQLNEKLITTQNDAKAWHHQMHVIINSEHIGVFKLIQELQKEIKSTAVDILDMCTSVRAPPKKMNYSQKLK
jgi:predicted HicB family RNase H-like nuclease